jgi:hypothetical protein
MKRKFIFVGLGLLLAACANPDDRIAFDGHYFRTDVDTIDGQRDHFIAEVRDASQSITGAREAGRYAAVSYCVGTYGSSDIKWIAGPDMDNLRLVDNRLRFEGICPQ